MAGTKEIKRRIKSVRNTKKITKAMELVAASKMKRAVASTMASRLYAEYSWQILTSIAESIENITHPLFVTREIGDRKENVLLILITSNRGLCGAYNAQVIKKSLSLIKNLNQDTNISILTIGKKGDVAMRRVGQNVLASFFELPDNATLADVAPISKLVISEYTVGNFDRVFVAYTDFISGLTQRPNIKQVLPISKASLKELIENLAPATEEKEKLQSSKVEYVFEGDFDTLLGSLGDKLTKMQIYQMLLESNASEQSSRMVAMKNASDASGEMIEDLTLMFNKARQANITREISEISAGMASVS